MKLWDRITAWWAGATAGAAAKPASLREAHGITVDDDEDNWRPLTQDAHRDLSPLTQRRMQDIAVYLWRGHPLARALIELPVAYLLAEGVELKCKDADAQKWLNAFWRDPINRMDLKLPKKVRELALFGEQCWPVFVNEASGHVRLGYLDPALIETVVRDPDNIEQPIGIVTVKDKKGKARRYRVIVNGNDDELFTERTQKIRETFTDGACFYYSINDLSNGARGVSDLLSAADWLDAYETFLFGEAERANALRAFFWDVTLTGATPDEVKKRAREISAPKPGGVRVHNEQEAWKAESPELGSYESANAARLFRNHILGGQMVPEHWFGGGGDVNRATAGEMGEPTYKVFSMRQRIWKHILEDVGAFVVRSRAAAEGKRIDESNADDFAVEAVFPELTACDTTAYAAALQQVVIACVAAIDRGLLTEETAVAIIAAIAGRLGVEFDAATELEAARAQAAKRAEQDVFLDPPAADEDAQAAAAD